MSGNNVKKPCIGCIYYDTCGSTTRTAPCDGRETKTMKKRGNKNEQGN